MKPQELALFAAAILCAGCADDPPATNHKTRAAHYHEASTGDREEGDIPPNMGMTKDQVLERYGQPVDVSTSRRGEIWSYVFNNFDARSFIPYYGGWHEAFKRRHSGSITFDSRGRVIDYQWHEVNPRGETIWR